MRRLKRIPGTSCAQVGLLVTNIFIVYAKAFSL